MIPWNRPKEWLNEKIELEASLEAKNKDVIYFGFFEYDLLKLLEQKFLLLQLRC